MKIFLSLPLLYLLKILSVSIVFSYAISIVQVFNFDSIHPSLHPAIVGEFLQYHKHLEYYKR